MTDQRKHMIKMIAAVLLILAVPALFFQFIGDNPMEVREKATRNIAVVNEDIGAEEAAAEDADKEPVQFGKEIASILDEDSPYEWTVLSRSAAVNGLKSQQYDAVIYIPSNFSNNILTYDEQQPSKAEFEYTVQNQLNAENRQRVLRELEDATNRVNKQMSSLYWSYVSQDMENVRQEFDRILEKEIAFQKAMLGFYKPSSKDLAGELTQQKQMLEQLQSTMKQAEEDSPERKNSVEQFEKSLSAFVKYVEDYQTYQEDQQQLLTKAQQESITAIQGGTTEVDQKQEETQAAFDKQGEQLAGRMTSIQDMLTHNQETANNLSSVRLNQAERQAKELNRVHADYVDLYIVQEEKDLLLTDLETKMKPLREEFLKDPGPDPDTTPPGDTGENGENPLTVFEASIAPETNEEETEEAEMSEEHKEILKLAEEINTIIGILETEQNPEVISENTVKLKELTIQIANIVKSIENDLPNDDSYYENLYNELLQSISIIEADNKKHIEDLEKTIANLTASNNYATGNMLNNIKEKEAKILKSSALTESRKNELNLLFEQGLIHANIEKAFDYYSYLSQYETILKGIEKSIAIKDSVLSNDVQQNRVKTILSINEKEQGAWDKLNQELPATEEEMKEVQASALAFMDQYSKDLEEQQTAIMEDLASMEESANTVLSQVQETDETVSRMPLQNSDGTTLVTNQQSIGQEIVMISDLMNSLGERQETVVSSTDALQQKVNEVQSEADLLNDKWATNVASTQLVRDDVFSILGNTLVDGQNNGYVYEHLANPLQISGDAPVTQAKAVPPVVILVIILISSLLIGYFSHYFKAAPLLVRGSMFGLLNLIVGLIISLFGLNIYTLTDERAIQWSIFTILLLFAASTIVRVAFLLGNFAGWLASVGLVAFFVSPLLALAAPNFTYEDPMSKVYISIQFDTNNLFTQAIIVLIGMIVVLTILPFVVNAFKNTNEKANQEHAHEM